MATSYREFRIELYEEHLEEASFLYEQRLGLLHDSEITWLDIEEFEERLEAHIDALIVGEELALDICQRQVGEGDFGELYAAICVFCRQDRYDLLGNVLKELDPDDDERVQAVADGLKDEMSAEWAEALIGGLERGYEKLIPIFARYVGYRRLPVGNTLAKLTARVAPVGLERLLWALGRVGSDPANEQLHGYLDHEDAAVRSSAAMALLRRGDAQATKVCRERALRGDPAMYLPLAVSGGRSDAGLLQKLCHTPGVTPEGLVALGVLGDLGAVRLLVEELTDDELAESAADALQLMTGADLREEAFIPEEVSEDELFEEELKVYRETGEGPRHIDGRPFGVNIERISQNPGDWRAWLLEHKSHFDPSQRYRLGKPFSLGGLVDTLISESSSFQMRSLACEELVIRYRIDTPFEVDMRVVEQKRLINAIARSCRANEALFWPGQWYFAGVALA